MDISINLCGIRLNNPIIASSGTFGFGREFSKLIDISAFGAIATKGLTLKPLKGNKNPRIAEVYGGIINSVGLENPGIDYFLENELNFIKSFDTKVIANINGFSKEEFVELTVKLSNKVDFIELNLSCPNVKSGGMHFGTSPETVFEIVKAVKNVAEVPIIVKLSPNVTSIVDIALAAQDAGADGISLINTIRAMAIDINNRKPMIANVIGGLSGPAIKSIAIRMVYECFNILSIPIIGMGGIMNGKDAIEFFLAGADAISIGTVNFINPYSVFEILDFIKNYLIKYKFNSIKELKGNIIV